MQFVVVVVVVVVMMSPSGVPILGGMPQRDEEFHPIVTVLGTHLSCHWSHQSTVGVLLPSLDRGEVNVQLVLSFLGLKC